MPRKYVPGGKKRYKKYDPAIIEEAVSKYLLNEGSHTLSVLAKKYGIHKSVLHRHCKGFVKKQGGQTVLTPETENCFIKYINVCSEWGYPLEALDLRLLVKSYLDKLGIVEKRFKDNLPGPDYVRSFLKRHKDKISPRISQNIKRNRAAVSQEIINDYFDELRHSLHYIDPANILNYHETNLSNDPACSEVVTRRGTKYPELDINHPKASTSVMIACTASGEMLPSYVVYKARNLNVNWTQNGPSGTCYNRTQSGWFDAIVFEDWIKTIVIPYFEGKEGKKCLIGDNLSSHLSIDLIQLCNQEGIDFIFLPANSTHLTHPLDVSFFRPMKIGWRDILLKWKKVDGIKKTTVPKGCFPKLLSKLVQSLKENAIANILAGFRETGIHPFNPSKVLHRLPTSENNSEDMECVDNSVLEFLQLRYGTVNFVEPNTKRKLEPQAGESVVTSAEDYVHLDAHDGEEQKMQNLLGREKRQSL